MIGLEPTLSALPRQCSFFLRLKLYQRKSNKFKQFSYKKIIASNLIQKITGFYWKQEFIKI